MKVIKIDMSKQTKLEKDIYDDIQKLGLKYIGASRIDNSQIYIISEISYRDMKIKKIKSIMSKSDDNTNCNIDIFYKKYGKYIYDVTLLEDHIYNLYK